MSQREKRRVVLPPDKDDLQRLFEQFGIVQQCRERKEVSRHFTGKRLDDRLSSSSVSVNAGQERQPREDSDQSAVAGGDGSVGGGLGAGDEPLSVLSGEEITAPGLIPIISVQRAYPLTDLCEEILIAGRFVQRERGTGEIGVIIDIGRMARAPVAPAVQQATVGSGHFPADELESLSGGFEPLL